MTPDTSWLGHWDRAIFDVVNQTMAGGVLDVLMPVLSNMVLWALPLGIVWLVFFFRTDRRGKLIALGCFLVVAATDQMASSVLKPSVARTRPCNVVPASRFYGDDGWVITDKFGLTTYKNSYSFPSSHAANVAGQAAYWSYFFPQVVPVLAVAALSVGISRVYLGHHWPSDILGGYLLGLMVALVLAYPLRLWVLPTDEPVRSG